MGLPVSLEVGRVSAEACRVPGTGQKSGPLQQAWRCLAAMRRSFPSKSADDREGVFMVARDRGTRNPVARWPLRTVISPGPVQGGQHASDDICSCDLEPAARSHFRRFAGNPDCPASGRSCERCRCRERHAGACVRLALPSITSLASLVLPASSALKSMSEHRTCSRAGPPKAARSRRLITERKLQASLRALLPNVAASWRWDYVALLPGR
jgi:hypothetical protein